MQVQLISISRDTLQRYLDQMEADWRQIDSEWGPTEGGLEGAVSRGEEPIISELRKILKGGDSA